MYCDNCIHREVCGKEGCGDPAMTFCDDRIAGAIPIEWLKKHNWYGVIEHWEKDQRLNNSKEVLYSRLEDHGFNSYEEYVNWAETIIAIPRDDRVKFLEEERKKKWNKD